jgi:hypothetical protein
MRRCDLPVDGSHCRRPLGHADGCRPTYHARPVCGAWMRYAREYCARTVGHAAGCRTRWALDNMAAPRRAA